MRIRQASIDDAAAISQLILPLGQKFIASELSTEGARTLLDSFECGAIAGYFQADYRYHVAEQGGQIIGVVGVRDNVHLYHLFVAEGYHRQGVARRLWNEAKRAAFAAGNPGWFTVNSSRFAVAVYRRLGFIETGPAKCSKGVLTLPMECTTMACDDALPSVNDGS